MLLGVTLGGVRVGGECPGAVASPFPAVREFPIATETVPHISGVFRRESSISGASFQSTASTTAKTPKPNTHDGQDTASIRPHFTSQIIHEHFIPSITFGLAVGLGLGVGVNVASPSTTTLRVLAYIDTYIVDGSTYTRTRIQRQLALPGL